MDISKEFKDGKLEIALKGRLDTNTAPQLEEALKGVINEAKLLEFDFTALDYISSAGLRVMLAAQKNMNKHGSMVITGANSDIKEVFDITGFSDILTVR